MNNRIYLSPPHLSGKELDHVHEAFASNWIAPIGPMVDAFEKEMCGYTGSPYAAAVSSGTAALHLALMLLGVKQGDEVLCSSFTFAGSAFPITYCGAVPVFVDGEERSWNMDPELLETAIRDRMRQGKTPKACIVVHLYGQSADMDAIMGVCGQYAIPVIEDAAESLGAFYGKKHTGTIAPLGVLSFNGNKIMTTSGGGMLVGKDKAMIERARFLATQARENAAHYEHKETGYNYRMSNIVAAIGRGQLAVLEERVAKKREVFTRYRETLAHIPGVGFMPEPPWGRANRWLTCMTLDPALCKATPETIRLALEQENIESRPLWKPMHLQPVFNGCPAYTSGVSEKLFSTGLCLPSGTAMSEADQMRVVTRISSMVPR
ncbi:MAG: aminotransferase class I/II-fold pyridoxal phosphate-dependent enzyme [Chitinispirillaceae bacterium]|nr:aminotransferase class I/II-fold pyridoxal phosphate-dependent enzyme [Chitinispirillaceae bacterium]